MNICEKLLEKGILPELNVNLFGFNTKKQLKYLILPNFETVNF